MNGFALAILAALVGSPAVAETCAPPTLTRIVTRSVGPDIVRGSFRAEPITLYRKGQQYLRHEEAPEPERRQHLLTIVASPDIWIVNQLTKTGRHIIDPGPEFAAKAPIVAGHGVPPAFVDLEFGCESAFAKARGRPAGEKTLEGRTVKVYALQDGDRRLEISLIDTGIPVEVAYYQGARTVLLIRYDAFQAGLPEDARLFQKPADIAFTDGASP